MADAPATGTSLTDIAARLDVDIAEADRHVIQAQQRAAELREMRANVEKLRSYAALLPESAFQESPSSSGKESVTDKVVKVFLSAPAGHIFSVEDIVDYLESAGSGVPESSIRNAVYYAANSGRLEKLGRGRFVLKDSSPIEDPPAHDVDHELFDGLTRELGATP